MIIVKENFLTPEEVEFCLNYYDYIHEQSSWESSTIPFWEGRVYDISNLIHNTGDRESFKVFIKILKRMQDVMMTEFNIEEKIHPDTMQIVRWEEGLEQPPHADNCNEDGSDNYTPWREYSGVLYLNDDYEGGHTYFTKLDREIQPKAGTAVFFFADLEHEHGVSKITKGERKTIVTFWARQLINKAIRLW